MSCAEDVCGSGEVWRKGPLVLSASLREQAGSYRPGEWGRQSRADGPLLAEDRGR